MFFNIITAIITTPLISFLVFVAKKVVKDKEVNPAIKETLEGDEKFAIRTENSFSSNLEDSMSRNTLDKTSHENEIDDNKYHPPIIVDNYFQKNKDDENENDIYIHSNNDEKNTNNVDKINLKEDNNENIIKNNDNNNKIILEDKGEDYDKKINKLLENENDENQEKNIDIIKNEENNENNIKDEDE